MCEYVLGWAGKVWLGGMAFSGLGANGWKIMASIDA
jgi:hypothetical protein